MTRPTLLRRLLCLANLCGTFITKSDNTGVWGECVICGRRSGFMTHAELDAILHKHNQKCYADSIQSKEKTDAVTPRVQARP